MPAERVTMSQLAARLGVSKNTISLALRHDPRVSAPTRQRVQRLAEQLGYARNPVVAQLMAELRKTQPAGYQRTFALLNAHRERDAFRAHHSVPSYVEGCRRRAALNGYRFDEFWLHDPELNGERLERILRTRGIRGAIVVGLFGQNRLPERFATIWKAHACVVTGVRTQSPTLSFSCVDHHELVIEALAEAVKLGYERPALVLEHRVDELVDGRFTAGMWTGQQALPATRRLPAYVDVDAEPPDHPRFTVWFKRHQPDVILTLHSNVKKWVEDLGLRVPRDLGLIHLERDRLTGDWAGMDQHNDLAAEAAVDMLVSMLHNNELGAPTTPRATLISASWTPGKTVRGVKK
jgi:LacI family transcriptional regulator